MKRNLPIFMIGIGLLVLSVSASLLLPPRGGIRVESGMPVRIADIPLTQSTTGREAISEVGDMHGKRFPIDSASIGRYGDRQITLWIAVAQNDSIAGQMIAAMEERIAEGNSPFLPRDVMRDGARWVYVLEGMGQDHYYFQSKNMVIWLAADPALSGQAIQQLLEEYP